jgi:hypothetical protein
MSLYLVIAVFIVVSIAFDRQNKDLKNVRKVSGRGGDFHD